MGTVCTWRHSLVRVRIHRMLYKIVVINIIVTPSGGSSQITEIIVPLSFYHNLLLVFLFPVLFLLFIKKNVISCLPIFNQFCAIYIAILMAFSCNGLEISSICNVQDPPPRFTNFMEINEMTLRAFPMSIPPQGWLTFCCLCFSWNIVLRVVLSLLTSSPSTAIINRNHLFTRTK